MSTVATAPAEAPETEYKIMGFSCTFAGPLDAVRWQPLSRYAQSQLIAKGESPTTAIRPRPLCPHCLGMVGKFEKAEYDAILDKIAGLHGQTPAELREMIAWAEAQPRCLPLDPRALGRAYSAHLRRAARNLKRAGRLQ